MKKISFLTLLALLSFAMLKAQETPVGADPAIIKLIHFEAGFNIPKGSLREDVAIRQNLNYNYNYYNPTSDGSVSAYTSGVLFGIRLEYFIPAYHSGISAGLRFTGFNTEIYGITYGSMDYFYLRYSEEGSDTRFARVKSLMEDHYVLSIPVELRIVPLRYNNLSLSFKAGVEAGILNLKNERSIDFSEESMNARTAEVMAGLPPPAGNSYATFYTAICFNAGWEGKPNYSLEILLPSAFLTKNYFSLIETDYFAGVKLSMQLPLKTSK
jgi:hypothetical protein